MTENSFIEELKKINIDISELQLKQLNKYYELLVEWNEKINLTAITKKEDVKRRMGSFKFGELDPNAIAGLFKGRYVTPQTFAKLDLDSIGERVYINPQTRKPVERDERIR